MNGPAKDAGAPLTPLPARTGYVSLDKADAVIDATTAVKTYHYLLEGWLDKPRLCLYNSKRA